MTQALRHTEAYVAVCRANEIEGSTLNSLAKKKGRGGGGSRSRANVRKTTQRHERTSAVDESQRSDYGGEKEVGVAVVGEKGDR